jgi:hypothetical protein
LGITLGDVKRLKWKIHLWLEEEIVMTRRKIYSHLVKGHEIHAQNAGNGAFF